MNPSTRLPRLRYALSRAYASRPQTIGSVTPGLHHLLSVPIRERLILLAKLDGADAKVIRRTLPVPRIDADCTSDVMLDAIATWRSTLQDAFWHVPTRANWRHQRFGSVDKYLRQLVWADAAVAILGEAALPQVVQTMTLRQRLIAYCLIVEEMRWSEVQALFKASEWEIRQVIRIGFKATGGSCQTSH